MNKKSTILQINVTSAFGGGPEHMFSLIKGLSRDKYNIVAVCPNDGPYFKMLNELGVQVIDIPVRKLSLKVLFDIIGVVRKNKVDLIHAHGKGAGLYGRVAGALTGVPVIFTFHGIHYKAYGIFLRFSYLLIERILSFFTAWVINVSKGELKKGISLGIINRRKSSVIYNGIDMNRLEARKWGKAVSRTDFGFKDGDIITGSVARFNVQKGHEYLIQAFSKIAAERPGAKLLLVGDGELLNEMKKTVAKLGIEGRVVFTGYREDAIEIIRVMDIYALASLWEGMPISLLEAMGCGKPVVATDVIGNNEIVVDRDTGFLVPKGDAGMLAEKIINLIDNIELRNMMGEKGKEKVKMEFSAGDMISKTAAVYERVLS